LLPLGVARELAIRRQMEEEVGAGEWSEWRRKTPGFLMVVGAGKICLNRMWVRKSETQNEVNMGRKGKFVETATYTCKVG